MPNYDAKADIHYGVISPHSLNPDAAQDIYDKGDNLSHAAAVAEAKSTIAIALRRVLNDIGIDVTDHVPADMTTTPHLVDLVWDEIEQDWNDRYEESEDTYRYERDGYILQTTSLGIYVIKSPFYTFAAACSPCCLNAGDLDTPRDGGLKTYCLGADWFDDDKREYPIYSVETGRLI
jgi:hypothetical protein